MDPFLELHPVVGKLLEALTYKKISTYLKTNALLNLMQFGFREDKLTLQGLLSIKRLLKPPCVT